MAKIKLDANKHLVLVKWLGEAGTVLNYEYHETKVWKWKNGVATEKLKQRYVLKASEEDFIKFINELIEKGRLEIETGADFKILKLEVFGKNTVAAHTSNDAGFITFTIKDFLSAYKFYYC